MKIKSPGLKQNQKFKSIFKRDFSRRSFKLLLLILKATEIKISFRETKIFTWKLQRNKIKIKFINALTAVDRKN